MKVKVIYPVRPEWKEFEEKVYDVGDIEAENPMAACELMFMGFNNVEENPFRDDPGFYSQKLNIRSMSIGDIVEVDGICFRCMPMGFSEINSSKKQIA